MSIQFPISGENKSVTDVFAGLSELGKKRIVKVLVGDSEGNPKVVYEYNPQYFLFTTPNSNNNQISKFDMDLNRVFNLNPGSSNDSIMCVLNFDDKLLVYKHDTGISGSTYILDKELNVIQSGRCTLDYGSYSYPSYSNTYSNIYYMGGKFWRLYYFKLSNSSWSDYAVHLASSEDGINFTLTDITYTSTNTKNQQIFSLNFGGVLGDNLIFCFYGGTRQSTSYISFCDIVTFSVREDSFKRIYSETSSSSVTIYNVIRSYQDKCVVSTCNNYGYYLILSLDVNGKILVSSKHKLSSTSYYAFYIDDNDIVYTVPCGGPTSSNGLVLLNLEDDSLIENIIYPSDALSKAHMELYDINTKKLLVWSAANKYYEFDLKTRQFQLKNSSVSVLPYSSGNGNDRFVILKA